MKRGTGARRPRRGAAAERLLTGAGVARGARRGGGRSVLAAEGALVARSDQEDDFAMRARLIPLIVGLFAAPAVAQGPLYPGASYSSGGSGSREIAAADLDGDGRLDLVARRNAPQELAVLLAKADGTYGLPTTFSAALPIETFTLGDMNGDGRLDAVAGLLATTSGLPGLAVLTCDGVGGFGPPAYGGFGARPRAVTTADVDQNGALDVGALQSNSLRTVFGDGAGNLGAMVSSGGPIPATADALALADFTGDALPDAAILWGGVGGSVRILIGTGTGAFPTQTAEIPSGAGPEAILAADLNGDAFLDLAVANDVSHNVAVLLGLGGGQFAAPVNSPAPFSPQDVQAADWNGDGALDLAVPEGNLDLARVLANAGAGSFVSAAESPVGSSPRSIAFADLDADGAVDLATANDLSSNVTVSHNDGTGAFPAAGVVPVGAAPVSVAAGDLDGDGAPDLVAPCSGSNVVSVALGNGAGAFAPSFSLGPIADAEAVALADLDHDGALDVVGASYSTATVHVFRAAGGGGFLPPTANAVGVKPRAIAAGELNGDGRLDLVVACAGSSAAFVLLGDGAGGFASAPPLPTGTNPRAAALADLDRDGDLDALVAHVELAAVDVFPGDGLGGFGAPASLVNPQTAYGIAAGDVNADGNVDLVTSGGAFVIYPGDGAGSFGSPATVQAGNFPVAVAIGDLDADGKPDLAAANFNSTNLSVALALGGGAFAPPLEFVVQFTPLSVCVADFDLDGKSDLAAAAFNSNSVAVLRNLRADTVGVAPYGLGTPGCAGLMVLGASGPPKVGAAGFGITSLHAPPSSFGLGLVGNVADFAGSDPFGVGLVLHVDLVASAQVVTLAFASDPSGVAFAPAPIPAVPSLAGVTVFAQALFVEKPGASCGASPFGLISSTGLGLTLQP